MHCGCWPAGLSAGSVHSESAALHTRTGSRQTAARHIPLLRQQAALRIHWDCPLSAALRIHWDCPLSAALRIHSYCPLSAALRTHLYCPLSAALRIHSYCRREIQMIPEDSRQTVYLYIGCHKKWRQMFGIASGRHLIDSLVPLATKMTSIPRYHSMTA